MPRSYIDNYANSLESVSEAMRGHLAEALKSVDYSRSVAEIRDQLIQIMSTYVYAGRSVAAQVAASFYDGLRKFETGEEMGAKLYDGYDHRVVDRRVRSAVEPLAEVADDYHWAGDPTADPTYADAMALVAAESVEPALSDYIGYSVKAAAGKTVFDNGRRDPRRVKYARVPRHTESYAAGCPFCQMLASRGFVYRSQLTAGIDPDHYHSGCRCVVVPSWGLFSVQGYNPRNYDKGYQEFLDQDHSQHDERVRQTQRNRYDESGRLKSGDGKRVDEKNVLTDEDRSRIYRERSLAATRTRQANRG